MKGKLAVISGFSGAGKGTVIRKLMETHEGYVLSVSMTTRKPRKGETDGVEYHFVTNEAFEELLEKDGFLEHAGFVDHYYGTPKAFVEENMAAGRDVLLEIEVQGAMQIRKLYPDAVLIFVAPPDAEELERRLSGRDTEKEETVTKRLVQAVTEVKSVQEYDYLVINDQVDACAEALNEIIRGRGGSAGTGGKTEADEASEGGRVFTGAKEKKSMSGDFQIGLTEIIARRGAVL